METELYYSDCSVDAKFDPIDAIDNSSLQGTQHNNNEEPESKCGFDMKVPLIVGSCVLPFNH